MSSQPRPHPSSGPRHELAARLALGHSKPGDREVAALAARAMFQGRRGHGGGPLTRRTLSERELADFARSVIVLARRVEDTGLASVVSVGCPPEEA